MRKVASQRQRGASIITAIFLITALAALAAAMSRMMIHANVETAHEFLSAQALHAAESGIDWAVYDLLHDPSGSATPGETTNASLDGSSGPPWYSTSVQSWTIDAGESSERSYYRITSTGAAGGSSGDPTVRRQIQAFFMDD